MRASSNMLDGDGGNCADEASMFRSSGGSSSSNFDSHQRNCDAGKMEETGTTKAIQEENCKRKAEEDLCSSPNDQITDISESRKRSAEQDTSADVQRGRRFNKLINWKLPNKHGGPETHATRSVCAEPRLVKVSEALACSLPNLQPRDEPDDEATSASGDMNRNNPAPTLMRLESFAENDLGRLAGKDVANTDSRICLFQEKGKGKEKEKAPSDGDMWARSSNDSHESMESCNSTRLFPKGVKRPNFGQPQIIVTKRTRTQVKGTHDSTSFVKPDSSFMKWILNMVKGLSDYSKEDPSPLNVVLNETTDRTRPSMGFQTVFQSMYNRNPKDNRAVAESTQLVVADGKGENSCKQIVLACTPNSSEKTNASESPSRFPCEKLNSSLEKTGLNFPLPVSHMPEKSSPFSSLWITRLYTRTDRFENCNLDANDVLSSDDCSVDAVRASDEMASVFAKRLDALRHIVKPSETRRSPCCQLICLFCGGNGHDLRKCPQLTAIEFKDLLVKISSFDKIEESPCLCIRCFQLDHWAISCPSHENKCSSKRPSTSNLFQKSPSPSSEHHLMGKHVIPPHKIIDVWNAVPVEEMFNAISKLRLSRANILRWMNSNVSLSHLNGFFLRLRVGKLEGGLEGTTYYVACITGDSIESVKSRSKKSISVDVGGIKSSVGSQYISNHDFLEDEIKAWWSRMVKSGCKIPSMDELNSKCEHRNRLSL